MRRLTWLLFLAACGGGDDGPTPCADVSECDTAEFCFLERDATEGTCMAVPAGCTDPCDSCPDVDALCTSDTGGYGGGLACVSVNNRANVQCI